MEWNARNIETREERVHWPDLGDGGVETMRGSCEDGAGSVTGRGGASGGRVSTRGGMQTHGGLTERPSLPGFGNIQGLLTIRNMFDLEATTSLEKARHIKRVRKSPKSVRQSVQLVKSSDTAASTPTSRVGASMMEHQIRLLKTPSKHKTPSSSAEPSPKRCLFPTSSPSSGHPLHDEKISKFLYYGSEEDSDEKSDEEVDTQPVFVPRSMRMFLDKTEDEMQVQPTNTNVLFEFSELPLLTQTQRPALPAVKQPHEPESQKVQPENSPYNLYKFDFNWRSITDSQIDQNLRREPFSKIRCGPTASFASPYEAFIAYWDYGIMEHIVRETNRYAEQVVKVMLDEGTMRPTSRMTKWENTTVDELYLYFAIVLGTGIVAKSRLEEYWNKAHDLFATPGFSAVMTYDRFYLLSKCLHFQDNSNCDPESMTRSEAKVSKIRPILDHLNNKFSQLYKLSQNVTLDESLTMWKGWLDINQFVNNKATTVGIKTYEICESKTGYLWRFEVHAGHEDAADEESPVSGTVPALVLRLLDGLEHKGHTIWMDNYYNSPALARELKTRGFDCVGTLRTNRRFVPTEIAKLQKSDMTLGQVVGCTSGDVDIVVWRDKNCVALISTYHGLRSVECGQSMKPSVIPDYNICMGGVDRKDQMLAMYPIERLRTRVWYKKLFRRLLNVTVLNAYILHKADHTIPHRNFRKMLVGQLISQHRNTLHIFEASVPGDLHVPEQYSFVDVPGKPERQRRTCAICKKRTRTYCKKCNVPLCVYTCFTPHIHKALQEQRNARY